MKYQRKIFIQYTRRNGRLVEFWRKAHPNSKAFGSATKLVDVDGSGRLVEVPLEHFNRWVGDVSALAETALRATWARRSLPQRTEYGTWYQLDPAILTTSQRAVRQR